jgi:hypothetical protein
MELALAIGAVTQTAMNAKMTKKIRVCLILICAVFLLE